VPVNQRVPRFFTSTVGTKVLVGLTGLMLCGFLVTHLAGNMLLYISSAAFNRYSHALTSNQLIYFAEAGLLAVFLVHLALAIRLTLENQKARPEPYGYKSPAGHTSRKNVGSATMIYTGLLILFFVVLHLQNFKFGTDYLTTDESMRDIHRTVLEYFRAGSSVLIYAAFMIVLGFHLWHGFSSAFQSLGIDHPKVGRCLVYVGRLFAVVISVGYLVLPIWMHFHYKK
jgi:succinate dehydrogenase / fumarate reductase cytochrome b subunit